ncbi:MAG: LuxR C-terminal-related transcriptional regulator [Flavobacteriales bacterium]
MNFFKIVSLIVAFLVIPTLNYGQKPIIDSLSNELIQTDELYSSKADLYNQLADESFSKGDYINAMEYDKKILSIYRVLKNEIGIGLVYIHIGDIYLEINDYKNSLKYYLGALQLFELKKERELLADTKKQIGDLYLRLEQCENGFKYLFDAKELYYNNQEEYKNKLSGINQSIGIAFGRCGSLDSALNYFQEALRLSSYSNNGVFAGGLLNNIGAIYSKKNEDSLALDYYHQSIKFFENVGSVEGVAVSKSNIAYVFSKNNKYKEAILLYLEALELFKSTNSLLYLRDNYLNLSEVYEKTKDYEKALVYNNLYIDLNDSISNSEVLGKINELNTQFELRKKDQKLLLLEQQNKIVERDNKLKQIYQYLLVGGLILLLIIAVLVYRNLKISLKNTKLKQQILKQEKEELTQDLKFKNHELEGLALNIIEKNTVLEQLKQEIKSLDPELPENAQKLKEISSIINSSLYLEKDRQEFELQLNKIHQSFFLRLTKRFPFLTKNEQRLCSLLVLDLSSKDISTILNISPDGVKKSRYRLRKKLNLLTDVDIATFLKTL